MPKAPAYLWYPKDMLDSERVENLSASEECWYRRALDRSWGDEGIPADPAKAARRIGKKCTVKAAEMILDTFFVPKKNDALKKVNEKQEILRKKVAIKIRQKIAAGKASGRKRRENKGLSAEHPFNGRSTDAEQYNPNPNPNSFSYEKEEEGGTPLLVHTGKILAGVMRELGLKTNRGLSNRQDWIEAGTVAFENDFTAEQFTQCFAELRKKHTYPILPKYVIDRLPDFVKKQKPMERLPTAEEKIADAAANNAAMRPPPNGAKP